MNLKSCVAIEITKNDRLYTFVMPVGSPFGEAYDVAYEVLNKIAELARDGAQGAKREETHVVEE
jgi:hypothetical protein